MNEPKPESRNTVQFILGKKYYDINITDQMLQKLYLPTYMHTAIVGDCDYVVGWASADSRHEYDTIYTRFAGNEQ